MQTPGEDDLKKSSLAVPARMLIATDLTDVDYLLPHVIAQAQTTRAQVTLLHAVSPPAAVRIEGPVTAYADQTKVLRDDRVALLAATRQLEAQGISCEIALREGVPVDIIQEELRRTGATRLIMGTHGRGKLGQLALGSVARELIARVNMPVFVVGPHARGGTPHATPKKILLPVSLIGAYRDSLDLAVELAQTYQAELTLLHVLDRDRNPTQDVERATEWAGNALRALVPNAANLAHPVRVIVTSGKVEGEILKAANGDGADWIILGADGGTRNWHFTQGATYKVLVAANCPVLTLRQESLPTAPIGKEEVHFTYPM